MGDTRQPFFGWFASERVAEMELLVSSPIITTQN